MSGLTTLSSALIATMIKTTTTVSLISPMDPMVSPSRTAFCTTTGRARSSAIRTRTAQRTLLFASPTTTTTGTTSTLVSHPSASARVSLKSLFTHPSSSTDKFGSSSSQATSTTTTISTLLMVSTRVTVPSSWFRTTCSRASTRQSTPPMGVMQSLRAMILVVALTPRPLAPSHPFLMPTLLTQLALLRAALSPALVLTWVSKDCDWGAKTYKRCRGCSSLSPDYLPLVVPFVCNFCALLKNIAFTV